MERDVYRIARREQFSENSLLWEMEAPDAAQAAQPGHFVMLCLREGGERIPLIYALGTRADPIVGRATKGLESNKWGYIVADDATQATNLPRIFAGGDIVTGATVTPAMSAGRRAARAIAAHLNGNKSWPPSAADSAAFVPPTPLATTAAR